MKKWSNGRICIEKYKPKAYENENIKCLLQMVRTCNVKNMGCRLQPFTFLDVGSAFCNVFQWWLDLYNSNELKDSTLECTEAFEEFSFSL